MCRRAQARVREPALCNTLVLRVFCSHRNDAAVKNAGLWQSLQSGCGERGESASQSGSMRAAWDAGTLRTTPTARKKSAATQAQVPETGRGRNKSQARLREPRRKHQRTAPFAPLPQPRDSPSPPPASVTRDHDARFRPPRAAASGRQARSEAVCQPQADLCGARRERADRQHQGRWPCLHRPAPGQAAGRQGPQRYHHERRRRGERRCGVQGGPRCLGGAPLARSRDHRNSPACPADSA